MTGIAALWQEMGLGPAQGPLCLLYLWIGFIFWGVGFAGRLDLMSNPDPIPVSRGWDLQTEVGGEQLPKEKVCVFVCV